jgi:hypothetical protein
VHALGRADRREVAPRELAVSIASPPPEPKKIRASSTGASSLRRSASRSAGVFANAPKTE